MRYNSLQLIPRNYRCVAQFIHLIKNYPIVHKSGPGTSLIQATGHLHLGFLYNQTIYVLKSGTVTYTVLLLYKYYYVITVPNYVCKSADRATNGYLFIDNFSSCLAHIVAIHSA